MFLLWSRSLVIFHTVSQPSCMMTACTNYKHQPDTAEDGVPHNSCTIADDTSRPDDEKYLTFLFRLSHLLHSSKSITIHHHYWPTHHSLLKTATRHPPTKSNPQSNLSVSLSLSLPLTPPPEIENPIKVRTTCFRSRQSVRYYVVLVLLSDLQALSTPPPTLPWLLSLPFSLLSSLCRSYVPRIPSSRKQSSRCTRNRCRACSRRWILTLLTYCGNVHCWK